MNTVTGTLYRCLHIKSYNNESNDGADTAVQETVTIRYSYNMPIRIGML